MVYLAPAPCLIFLLVFMLDCVSALCWTSSNVSGKSLEASYSVCSSPGKRLHVQENPNNLISRLSLVHHLLYLLYI